MTVPIRSITFWINAFIPGTIPGYTRPVPGRAGQTMIPGPPEMSAMGGNAGHWLEYAACLSPLVGPAACNVRTFGYHTDNRGFDGDINTLCRMHARIKVDHDTGGLRFEKSFRCDESIAYDLETGDIVKRAFADTKGMTFAPVPRGLHAADIELRCTASNPLIPPSTMFGSIDFFGRVSVDFLERTLRATVYLDDFPAFEAYASINEGAGVPLFQRMPEEGSTAMSLGGLAGIQEASSRKESAILVDADRDGVFEVKR